MHTLLLSVAAFLGRPIYLTAKVYKSAIGTVFSGSVLSGSVAAFVNKLFLANHWGQKPLLDYRLMLNDDQVFHVTSFLTYQVSSITGTMYNTQYTIHRAQPYSTTLQRQTVRE